MANSESSEMANDSKAEESQPPPPPEPPGFVGGSPTLVEELVAKSIAPVKREFLRPPPVRERKEGGGQESDKSISSNQVVKQKKSKRQLKRERREERKSALNLCPEVAKSGNTNSCRYGDKCRFSHDMESYKAQKPADLEGNCPFTSAERPCPYGLTCRFSGAHKDVDPDGKLNAWKEFPEVNTLNKDVQKLLWKNKMKFLAADAALKGLGLASQGKGNSRIKTLEDKEENGHGIAHCTNGCQEIGCAKDDNSVNKEVCSPLSLEENSMEVASVDEESRPLKRAKPKVNEKSVAIEVTNGGNVSEENCDETLAKEVTRIESDVLPDIDGSIKLHPREKKIIDFRGQRYLAPLTTVGNLPFRRVCKVLGADVTCGEMAMCTNLLQGQASEWALLRRHTSEDLFGVQICGAYPDTVARAVDLIERECSVDFIDINMGCPIDIVVNKGAGSALLTKSLRMKNVIQAACAAVETPITVKVRTGYFEGRNRVDSLIADIGKWGATAVTIHGRSRQQRYSKLADWEYIYECVKNAPESIQVLGNGDVFSYLDWNKHFSDCPRLSSCMIARGALIKPWIFTEIKEQRHWDISSGERLDILKDYVRFGLEHWGSDSKGVETTRHFLLEWLSYICRYIPIGLLDVVPQRLNWRPPSYFGRNDLETLMASDSAADWIRISELLLGKVPSGFTFAPKHKSNA